jgi:ATP-binding cassette subfamily B protein
MEGEIRIGGVDIRDMKFDDLMKRSALCFGRVLFKQSIYDNIASANPGASDEQVIAREGPPSATSS